MTELLDEDAQPEERSKSPLYLHIAAELQDRIQRGVYPVSSLLPAEAELTQEFGTSRNTVREALRLLVERGLVRRRQGSGTLVTATAPHVQYVLSINKLDDLFASARDTYYALHSVESVRLDDEAAARIGATAGETWLLVTGVRWTERGGTALAFIESYVPMAFKTIVDGFWNVQQSPFYAVLEKETGFSVDEVIQDVRALAMPRRVANTFGLPEGSISLQVMRRYMTRAGALIASVNWHRGDQFTYNMRMNRSFGREGRPAAEEGGP